MTGINQSQLDRFVVCLKLRIVGVDIVVENSHRSASAVMHDNEYVVAIVVDDDVI